MALVTLSSGKSFESGAGTSILDAAVHAQILLPYSCKTGRCSTCKCKVLEGTTQALQPESGLTEQERSEGWVLSCVRMAQTDVLLEVDDLGGVELPTAKTWPCRISEISRLAPDVIRVLLRLPPAVDFRFLPGQYIDIIGPNGVRRSYSLARADYANKVLELQIRAVPGGAMSDYWFHQAKPNDLLRLHGPLGTFFLRDTAGIDLVFLATGTGIAPVKAMLESMVHLNPDQLPTSVTVLWGGRQTQDLYLNVDEIPGDFSYIPVLSRPTATWLGATGHIQNVLLNTQPGLTNAAVYACGSDAMIHSAQASLAAAGLPAKRFYSDAFVGSGNQ
ncbi:MAG: 2Fe-2S iron-sulfur cluster-binding protein [Rhodoferax sp.]